MSQEIAHLRGVADFTNWENNLTMLLRVINTEADRLESISNDSQGLPKLISELLDRRIRLFLPHLLHISLLELTETDFEFKGCVIETFVKVGDRIKKGTTICKLKALGEVIAESDGYVARILPSSRRFLCSQRQVFAYVAVFGEIRENADFGSCRLWLESQEKRVRKASISPSIPILSSYHPSSLSERQRDLILPKICEIIQILTRTHQELMGDFSQEIFLRFMSFFADLFFPLMGLNQCGPHPSFNGVEVEASGIEVGDFMKKDQVIAVMENEEHFLCDGEFLVLYSSIKDGAIIPEHAYTSIVIRETPEPCNPNAHIFINAYNENRLVEKVREIFFATSMLCFSQKCDQVLDPLLVLYAKQVRVMKTVEEVQKRFVNRLRLVRIPFRGTKEVIYSWASVFPANTFFDGAFRLPFDGIYLGKPKDQLLFLIK